jgi:autotransporter-associated beta strand protein
MDASAAPVPDAVVSGGMNLAGLLNGATLTNASFSGFGSALNTASTGPGKNAVLAASTTAAGNVTITVADTSTGAFTFEAIVWIGFDPTTNGTGSYQIISGESSANANRIFQWRILPKTAVLGAVLTFENLRALSGNQGTIQALLPTTGPDAIAMNNWYHVAVSYNGQPSTANNLKFYWTLLDPARTAANQISISTATTMLTGLNPLATITTPFMIGNLGRNVNGNFLGMIDEVRISNIERDPRQMMFTAAVVGIVTEPANQFVAAGDNVLLTVGATGQAIQYQWQFYGTNLPSATNSTLVISNIAVSQAGPYQVIVSNSAPSSTNSTVATITVGAAAKSTFNTGLSASGTLLSGGDVDAHWQLVYSDDPLYPGPAAVVVGSPPGSYLANGPSSMWIAPVASGSAASGDFIYQTSFILDTINPTNTIVTGGWAMDNQGMDILLNGVSTGVGATGFGGLNPFTIANGVHTVDDGNGGTISITNSFVPGLNTLQCIVSNYPSGGANPTGLRAEYRAIGLPLPPTPVQFTATPVNVTTQSQQTATFSAIAFGSGPLAFQWYQGPTPLAGQTNRTLVLAGLTPAQAGTYTVVVTNSLSSTNASATLTVISPPALAWLGRDPTNPSWWDTATVNWRDTGSSANVAFAPYDDVIFDDRGSATPNVDLIQPLTPNSVTVNSDTTAYMFDSVATGAGAITGPVVLTKLGAATLTLDVTNNSTGPTLIQGGTLQVGNNDANGSLGSGPVSNNAALVFTRYDTFVVPNTISGTGTVTMAGSGTLALSGNNNYTGPTVINSGTISPRSSNALGRPNSSVTVASGAQLYIFGDVNLAPVPLTLSGSGPGNGALRKANGAGTVFGGPITLAADAMIGADGSATFILSNGTAITGTNVNLDLWNDTSSLGTIASPISLGTGMITKDGAGSWTLTATNSAFSGGITVNAGTLQIGDGGADGSLGTGPLTINGGTLTINSALPWNLTNNILNNGTLTIAGSGDVLVSGEIDGAGALINSSGTSILTSSNFYVATVGSFSTVTLSTSNTYSGNTTIRGAGVVRATASSALGTGTCIIGAAQTDVSRLELAGGITLNNAITIFPRIFFGTASGITDVAADILNVSGTNILSPPSSIIIASGGNNLTLQSDSGDLILTAGVTAGGVGRFIVLRGAGSGEIQGALDQTGANSEYVVKTDSGTWTLWGTNTPGQTTTISNGVLVVNGSMDTNLVTVAGGTLAGTGVFYGPVVVNSGATLAPGPGIGTITISNNLTLATGSFTSLELDKTLGTSDHVIGISSLTYGGTLVVTNLAGTLAVGDTFKLFDAATYTGAFSAINPATPGAGALRWDRTQLAVNGTLGVVTVGQPAITSVTYGGGQFTISGTNGTIGQTFYVLSSTNAATPLANWSRVATNVFTGNAFTNTISVTAEPKRFYLISIP